MAKKKYKRKQYAEMKYREEKDKVIDQKVEMLKTKLEKLSRDYYKEVYKILKNIIELRKEQFKQYGIHELVNEKRINLSYHQVAYIFNMDYFSEKTKQLIDEGRLKTSTALLIIRQHNKFRESQYQDKAIDMYLKGALNTTEISRNVYHILDGTFKMTDEVKRANKDLINIQYQIQEKMKVVRSKRKLFTDRRTMRYIIALNDRFNEEIKAILKLKKGDEHK